MLLPHSLCVSDTTCAVGTQEQMDRKFGAPWNVVIGEYFSFEITFEVCAQSAALMVCALRKYVHVGCGAALRLRGLMPRKLTLLGSLSRTD